MRARNHRSFLLGSSLQREVVDLPESRKPDTSLDNLLAVRRQRLERLERERGEARLAWRAARAALRAQRQGWRRARQETADFWQQARQEFFSMTTTSGEFRRAKAVYIRMQTQVSQLLLECREAVLPCRASRATFFAARRRVREANLQCEKLSILRHECALLTPPPEI